MTLAVFRVGDLGVSLGRLGIRLMSISVGALGRVSQFPCTSV
jgi:hypothetical protein